MNSNLKIVISAISSSATRAIMSLKSNITSIASSGAKFAMTAAAKAAKVAAVGLAAALVLASVSVVKLGANQEQTRLKFQTMLGSVAKGNKLLKELQNFANVTPFKTDEVVKAGQTLLAFGIKANDVQSSLRKIGDISAGTGKDLNELSAIYGKVMTKGKMDTEALNQLSEAGVPIIQTLAKQYGQDEAAIYKMAETGKLSSKDLQAVFTALTADGAMFGNMMEKQSQTAAGMWSTVVGSVETATATLGEQLMPAVKKVLAIFVEWSSKMVEMANDGSLLALVGKIATTAVLSIASIIKWGSTLANHLIASFKTVGAYIGMVWYGIKTGFLAVITSIVAVFEGFINGILKAYNVVISAFGGKEVQINWNATSAMGQVTTEAAQATAENYEAATSGKYFTESYLNNWSFDKEIDAFTQKINKAVKVATTLVPAKESDQPDQPATSDKSPKTSSPTSGFKIPKINVDSLTKIGGYNFGIQAINSIDKERNNLLTQIRDGINDLSSTGGFLTT